MKKLLLATFVALLLAGCGGEKNDEDSNDTENNASALAPPVVQPVKAPFDYSSPEQWADAEANPDPYGLAKIKKAKESGATELDLSDNEISDLSLAGLTKLEDLSLDNNQITEDQREMLKKALPNCDIVF